jgi:DNA primase large subunit
LIRNLKDEDLKKWIQKGEDKYMPLNDAAAAALFNLEKERQKDYISHFILRLAFCKTEDSRRWFVNHEAQLMKFRYLREESSSRENILLQARLDYPILKKEKVDQFSDNLIQATSGLSAANLYDETFYTIPFEDACDLVARRAVFLNAGIAYVPHREMLSILMFKFKSELEEELLVGF